MIEIFQGRIGGGKTYNAVLRIAKHLSIGGHCYTNIELNHSGLTRLVKQKWGKIIDPGAQLHFLERDEIPSFNKTISAGEMGLPVLVIIDEAHLFFNARSWAKADPNFLTFLTQSRKVSVDVIFITQSSTTIDKQLRVQAQYVWAFKDLQKFLPWLPPLIMCCQFDVDQSNLLHTTWMRKEKQVFDAYNTNALLKPIDFGGGRLSKIVLRSVSPRWKWLRFLARAKPAIGAAGLAIAAIAIYRVTAMILDIINTHNNL